MTKPIEREDQQMGLRAKRYTPEFRHQIVELHRNGRSFAELVGQPRAAKGSGLRHLIPG